MPIPNQAWQSLIYAGPNEQQEIESGDGGVGGLAMIAINVKCGLKKVRKYSVTSR